jgi:hypothetical protein
VTLKRNNHPQMSVTVIVPMWFVSPGPQITAFTEYRSAGAVLCLSPRRRPPHRHQNVPPRERLRSRGVSFFWVRLEKSLGSPWKGPTALEKG